MSATHFCRAHEAMKLLAVSEKPLRERLSEAAQHLAAYNTTTVPESARAAWERLRSCWRSDTVRGDHSLIEKHLAVMNEQRLLEVAEALWDFYDAMMEAEPQERRVSFDEDLNLPRRASDSPPFPLPDSDPSEPE